MYVPAGGIYGNKKRPRAGYYAPTRGFLTDIHITMGKDIILPVSLQWLPAVPPVWHSLL